MEKTQVSTHTLTSDYSIRGKLKTLIIGWTIYLVFLFVRTLPLIQNLLISNSSLKFLASNFWYFFAVLMISGTIITLLKKHPYKKIYIYNTGIGFVNDKGDEKYLKYESIKLSYGKFKESIYIELLEDKKTTYEYAWKEFTGHDVLKNNLEKYGSINRY